MALPRDLLRAITRLLLDDNAGRMPDEIENGICDLFSSIDVNATRVKIGAPLPAGELAGERLRGWAKLQMMATQPEYSGKLRTYINNMQNAGEEDQAALAEALNDGAGQQAVRSLRRDLHDRDETCWLHGNGWCLSKQGLH